MDNRQMSCKEARQIPIDAGFGDIHAGTYCPPLSFGLVICPQGFYCNSTDMTEALPCPAGMFCPYKVSFQGMLYPLLFVIKFFSYMR